MKFFIDTASVSDIREAADLGLLDGVTTNPTLLSREEGDPQEILRQITKIVEGPVSAEVTALDAEGMVREALELRKIADNNMRDVARECRAKKRDVHRTVRQEALNQGSSVADLLINGKCMWIAAKVINS